MNIYMPVLPSNKAQLSPGSPLTLSPVQNSSTCTTESTPGRASEKSGLEGKSSFHEDRTGTSTLPGRSSRPPSFHLLDSWGYSSMRSSLVAPLKCLHPRAIHTVLCADKMCDVDVKQGQAQGSIPQVSRRETRT